MSLFPPQGCYGSFLYDSGWQVAVLVGDVAFFLAYAAISLRLLKLQAHVRRLGMAPWVLPAFALFIFLCGSYHLATAAGTIWIINGVRVAVTLLGAAVSVGVATMFWPLVRRLGIVIDAGIARAQANPVDARGMSRLLEIDTLSREKLDRMRRLYEETYGHEPT